jgi:hypothetical protein
VSSLIHRRCLHHPGREAVALCPECRRFYCRECVTEHAGRMICAGCVARLASVGGAPARSAPAVWWALALGGLLLAWLVFYYFGMSLARIPSSFHGGPA